MRKKIKILISILIFFSILAISFLFYFKSVIDKPLDSDKDIVISVEDGDSFTTVLNKLKNDGYLRNELIIKLKIRMDYENINILPGSYEVDKDISLKELINMLETEDINKNLKAVTIPEGYGIDDMSVLFDEKFSFTKEEFLKAVKEYDYPSYIPNDDKRKYKLEGYLYPNTYYFNINSTPEEIISIMLSEFEDIIDNIEKELNIQIKEEELDTIINKASLIEKEVKSDKEKEIVASVIDNRIKKDMKLQFCSTVNYVLGYKGKEVLTYSDIEVDSLYNTYKYKGLPVGPICSPSDKSIKAVLNPAKTDYLYFVLSEDNETHYFSKTAEEHEAAKKKAEASR